MIIDGHSHACGRFLTAESIVKTLNNSGVDKVVLVPGELNSTAEYSLPNIARLFPTLNVVKVTNCITLFVMKLTGKVKDIPAGNEYVFNLKMKIDGNKVIQFIWITKGIKNPSDYLEKMFVDWNFQGVKLHQGWETFSIDSDFFNEVANWAENHGLPLFIHLFSDKEVSKIIDYKRKHPKLILIVAHLFGLELFIKENFKDENLYFDTSTIQLISNFRLMKSIDFFGADKIMFGTDTPYGAKDNIHRNISRINNLEISSKDKDLILGLNLKRLLKL
ncbi:amidohydrolase family protein [Candidatus Neomarinimicrobiota bacterium]